MGWDWDWDLCAGLLYEHRFAMLKIKLKHNINKPGNSGGIKEDHSSQCQPEQTIAQVISTTH